MSIPDSPDSLTLGEDYIILRWTDDSRDENGHLIWHEGSPGDTQWNDVRMVTVDYDPGGEGDPRNLAINPDRPLDPPGASFSPYGPEPYDIDDLATGWKIISP